MKRFIFAFLIFLIWSFFGLWLFSSLTGSNNELSLVNEESLNSTKIDQIEEQPTDTITPDSIKTLVENIEVPKLEEGFKAVTEKGDLVFLFEKGITISKNTSDISIPSVSVDFKYKLNTYLIEHPEEELHILSYYDPSENLESPNFGLQRGVKMRQLLAQAGLEPNRMVVKPTIKKIEFDSLGNNTNGIGFIFRPLDEERLNNSTINIPVAKAIYPSFVNSNIYANDELKEAAAEMERIFTEYPNVTVDIIGHTDNVGNGQDNFRLGLKYAQQVRWFLTNKIGLDKNRINALSKGEDDPIADNKLKQGRLLNRRIEIKYNIE